MKVKIPQLCPTLHDPMDYTVHGILHARILEWVAFPFSRGVFPTQRSNPGLLHYRQILYQLSHKGSKEALVGYKECNQFILHPDLVYQVRR